MMEDLNEYEVFANKMETAYPKMFADRYGGFAVGAGWWPILEALCANIQSHIDWRNRESETVPQVVVEQIKEKFGGLRFYYQGGDEQIHGMVRMAEAWADASCEECGAPGIRRNGGWIRTLCDMHEAEHQERLRTREMKSSGFEE
jgi:hypothetical protein